MTPWQEIRSLILLELSSYLGVYSFKVGNQIQQVPAIHVYPPQPPEGRAVEGLEVVINRTPEVTRNLLLNNLEFRNEIYTIWFVEHSNNKSLYTAVEKFLSFYTLAESTFLPQNDIAKEQAKIVVPFIKRYKLESQEE